MLGSGQGVVRSEQKNLPADASINPRSVDSTLLELPFKLN